MDFPRTTVRALRRSSRCKRSNGSLHRRHPFRGVYERQRSDAFTGAALARGTCSVFADLNQYAATMHFLGQTMILTLTRDRGTGETYCMPHHLTVDGKNRRLMIAALRYTDTFVKMDGAWLFAERKLYVDWLEQRELS